MKKNRNKLIKKIIIALYMIMVILIILLFTVTVGIIYQYKINNVEQADDFPEETQTHQTQIQETQIQEPESEECEETQESLTEAEIVYTEPEYDFKLEEITIEIPNLTREYNIAWVSDLHLVSDLQEADDVQAEFVDTIKNRYNSMFITDDGIHADELWPEIVKFLNYEKFDGIVFGGDMLDYCSRKNMDVFMEQYKKLNKKIPLLYIRADHDYGFWYGGDALTEPDAFEMHKEVDGDDLNDKYIDFDEFIIVGVNRSVKDIYENQFNIIQNLYSQEKPVIAVTHVPYESVYDNSDLEIPKDYESLEDLSMAVRNKIYYWTYFSKQGQYIPNDITQRYMDMIYSEDTSVCKVLAGHLHSKWEGMISENVSQHIFTPAYTGTIGIIHVVPAQ